MVDTAARFGKSMPAEDVIELLKTHDYFDGVSDAVIREIAHIGTVASYDAAEVVQQIDDSLTSISFILRGREKSVRVESMGNERLFQMFERGYQYGTMLAGVGESLSLCIFGVEPASI